MNLQRRIAERTGEFLLFAVTPPRLTTGPEQTRQIAEVTLERLRPVGIDGLVLYDIDDESDRNRDERPFPFLPTMDPAVYLARDLATLDVPAIVYRAVSNPHCGVRGWEASRMEFGILGPLEVRDGERRLELGGARQRALLALLLLRANEVVSSDELIAQLWSDAQGGAKALRVAVSRLRQTLQAQGSAGDQAVLLVTRAPGYELCLERDELDLYRFEDLFGEGRAALARGDAAAAAEMLRRALALWRGAPLADLAYESFSQHEIGRLVELRAAVLEERVAADLELGGHVAVVSELQELSGRHPLRERLRAMLMLALYRSGRQADALGVYRDARRVLTEELGIEPGRELRELQQAILRQDAALDLRTRVGRAREPVGRAFVGREREWAELLGALDDAHAGRGQLVVLVGEPGIGKSRLADELVAHARGGGARAVVGRCWEAGGAPAYWPWVQSLRAYVAETDAGRLRALLEAEPELVQLLPDLQEFAPDLLRARAIDAEGDRFRLFDAVSRFLRAAAQDEPLVVVLDDLHAADEPSLLLLRFLAREMAASRLLVVCALRDVDPVPREPINAALAELAREPHTRQVVLSGLTAPDVARYVESSGGVAVPPRVVEAIHAETEGNPLFVAELVALLRAEGRLTDPDADLGIPPGVRAVIGRRVGRLPERCRSVLLRASVLGREFDVGVLAALTGVERGELLDVLDEAIAERVIGEMPGSAVRMRFAHVLIRDTLYDELAAGRRMRLHRSAGEAIEAVYAGRLEPHLAELAHHFFAAATAGDAEQAIAYARDAGGRAATQFAFEEAARLYRMALTLQDDLPKRCDLLLAVGDAQARAGDAPAARRSFREAADLAQTYGLRKQLVDAALGYGGRLIWEVSRGDIEHVALLERALAATGEQDSAPRVRLLTRLAGGPLRDAGFAPTRRHALSDQALAMARRIGCPATLAYALAGYIAAHHSPAFTPMQVRLAGELIEVAMRVGDLERAAEGHEHRLAALVELGDVQAARCDLAAMTAIAAELRQPSQDWFVAVYDAMLALLAGDLIPAEDHIANGRVIGERAQSWNANVTYGLQLYLLRRDQGRLTEVEELVRRSAEEHATYPVWRCVFAQMAAQLGHADEARHTLDALATDRFAGLPFDEEWLVSTGFLAEAAYALDAVDHAATLYELLLPYADRVATSPPEISTGATARHLALLAATQARWTRAETHFAYALELHERIGAGIWKAHTAREYARMLIARGRPGDRREARRRLDEARAAYRALGVTEP